MSKKASKEPVSYKLLDKKEIADILDRLTEKPEQVNFEKSLSELVKMDKKQVFLACLERIKKGLAGSEEMNQFMKTANLLSVISELYDGERFVVKEIMAFTQKPGLPQETKMLLLSFLVDLGVDQETVAALVRPEELMEMEEYAAQNMVGLVKGDLAEQLFFLHELGSFDSAGQEKIMRKLVADDTDAAVDMLGILAYACNPQVATAAVCLLAENKRPRTFTVLQELAAARDQAVSAAAAEELKKFAAGSLPEPSRRVQKKPLGQFHDAVVSSFDGAGSRTVWLSWLLPGRKRQLIGVCFLLNTTVGIKDCFSTPGLTKKEFELAVEEITVNATIMRGDYKYCLTLIRDALAKSAAAGYPVPIEFAFWRKCLAEEIYPQVYEPAVTNLVPKSGTQVRQRFERSDELFRHREFSNWYQDTPQIYDITEKIMEINRKFRNKPNHLNKLADLEQKSITGIIKPILPELQERFLLTIDYLNKTGQVELAKDAMVCLVTLNMVPVEEHPFIRRMYLESVKAATENLSYGFDPRTNPDCE